MMRYLCCSCIALFVGLGLAVSAEVGALAPKEQNDPLPVNSVWRGTCEQSDPKSSYPMILFVGVRKGDTFEGTTWYPTLGKGLLKVSGRIDAKGAVTFTEEKLLYGEAYGDGQTVVTGVTYSATADRKQFRGGAEVIEYTNPKTGKTIKLDEAIIVKFSLKLAD